MTDYQGVSLTEAYDNRSVMAQIARLKDRVKALEEGGGTEDIEREIELINEELTVLEGKVGGLEEGAASLAEDVAALETGKADANNVVKLTGAQTVWGVKAFDSSPIVPEPRNEFEAATKKYVDDSAEFLGGLGISIVDDVIGIEQSYADNLVKKTGNQQTINSLLVFNTRPKAPGTPADASEVANKQYVDDAVAGGGGGGGTYYAGTGLSLANDTFSLDTATQTTLGQVAGKADDNAVVKLSGAQTVAGVKTFSSLPVIPTTAPTSNGQAASKKYVDDSVSGKADDSSVVKLTGAQTVAGVKTFDSSPIVPTPTTDYQVATKKYVDDNAGGGGGSGPWTSVATAQYTEAMFYMLFTAGTLSDTYVALKDVTIYIVAYTRPNSSNEIECMIYIPKGTCITSRLDFVRGTTNTRIDMYLRLPVVFNVSGASGAVAGKTVETITSSGISVESVSGTQTFTMSDVPYTHLTSGWANTKNTLCIQYR